MFFLQHVGKNTKHIFPFTCKSWAGIEMDVMLLEDGERRIFDLELERDYRMIEMVSEKMGKQQI